MAKKCILSKTVVRSFTEEVVMRAREHQEHATVLMSEATRLMSFAMRIRSLKGCRWRDVRRRNLENGRMYVIRRVNGKKLHDPVIAQWADFGWREMCGKIAGVSDYPSTLQVWSK